VNFDDDGTTDARTHNAANEILTRTAGNPSYDDAGNLTDDGENYKYVYDYRNRLIELRRKSDSKLKAKYEYDGLNRRVRKVVYDLNEQDLVELSDTWYIYDGWRCIEERDLNDSNELRVRHLHGGTYIDEHVRQERDTDANGSLDLTFYLCQDANYNVVSTTDTDGVWIERVAYKPYGESTLLVNTGDGKTATGNESLFQGQRYDAESGLYYYRYRMMSPVLGRFLQRDPLGYVDGMNLYELERAEPIRLVDPEGTSAEGYSAEDYKIKEDGTWTKVNKEDCCFDRDEAETKCVQEIMKILMSYVGVAPAGSYVKDIAFVGAGGVITTAGIATGNPVVIVAGVGLALIGIIDAAITLNRLAKIQSAANRAVYYFCDCHDLDRKRFPRTADRPNISVYNLNNK
jgi:RHS repeat-associated protein